MSITTAKLLLAITFFNFISCVKGENDSTSGNIKIVQNNLQITLVARYFTGLEDVSATEVLVYASEEKLLFSTNAYSRQIDIIDIQKPDKPTLLKSIALQQWGNKANSIAIYRNLLAVAVEDTFAQRDGRVVFFDLNGDFLHEIKVGSLPDMLVFTSDGKYLLVANEGEPTENYSVDPEGSVSIITIPKNIRAATVRNIYFKDLKPDGSTKIYNGALSVAADLEPEYITIAADNKTAVVCMQENNAFITIDIEKGMITDFYGLGYKNHQFAGNGLSTSDRNTQIQIKPRPVFGLYQPDAITSITQNDKVYILSANEGDIRKYHFNEAVRLNKAVLDSNLFNEYGDLQNDLEMGRLQVNKLLGDKDGDGDLDSLFTFGARSFSVRTLDGVIVYDSGDEFERILKDNYLNTPSLNTRFIKRSDDKGPEPEGIVIGIIDNKPLCFIGLERMGGVMVYNIEDVTKPEFMAYLQASEFAEASHIDEAAQLDLNPEGLLFLPANKSPNGSPMLIVANEVSGTITLYNISFSSKQ